MLKNKCCLKCCNNFFIGCLDNCGDLNLNINADVAGVFGLQFYFAGTIQTIENNFNAGELIKFNLDSINENYNFKAQLYFLNGDIREVKKFEDQDNNIFDCIEFITIQGAQKENNIINLTLV